MSERLRDDLLSENDFIQGEVMLLLKPSGEVGRRWAGCIQVGHITPPTRTSYWVRLLVYPNRKLDLYHEIPKISYANDGKFIKERSDEDGEDKPRAVA